MAKRKISTDLNPVLNLPRRLREGLAEADLLLERGKTMQALDLLKELSDRYPNQVEVLEMLAEA